MNIITFRTRIVSKLAPTDDCSTDNYMIQQLNRSTHQQINAFYFRLV